ncbi:alpha/beta fold hydrolase [Microlunatus soli]|uniref:alpha/beta fold hydrolase n=1 Tax=Microlunatus soli TaxID=630515 RepID=UPI001561706D|nr:alpha/beta hydrolase [Microlunatus soli]
MYVTAADGVRISFQVTGNGPETLLLLAGQANNHHWWDRVRRDFDGSFRTVTLDWRGTGDSDKPDTDSYATRDLARDAVAVLDELGAETTLLYGASMGGRVAQWIAADHPDRIDRLILGCTSPGGEHGIERSDEVRRALAVSDPAAARQTLLELMYSPTWLARNPGPYFTLGDPDMPAHARRRHRIASARHDAWDVLPTITAPTMIIHGTDDRFNPTANAALLGSRIPRSRVQLIAGARHAYFDEARTQASPLASDFLSRRD